MSDSNALIIVEGEAHDLAIQQDMRIEEWVAATVATVSAKTSKSMYGSEVRRFLQFWRDLRDDADSLGRKQPSPASVVEAYRDDAEIRCTSKTVAKKLVAVRKLMEVLTREGVITQEQLGFVRDVKAAKSQGRKVGVWLREEEVARLIAEPGKLPGKDKKPERDRLILALLFATAMRRDESRKLRWSDIKQQNDPGSDGYHWVFQNIQRKANRTQSITIPAFLKDLLDAWREIDGGEGYIFKGNRRKGDDGEYPLSDDIIYQVVMKYGIRIGFPDLRPHSMRRTAAQYLLETTEDIRVVSDHLGHADQRTTEKYLKSEVDHTRINEGYGKFNLEVSGE